MNRKKWNEKLKSLINIRRANEIQVKSLEDNIEEMDVLISAVKEHISTLK